MASARRILLLIIIPSMATLPLPAMQNNQQQRRVITASTLNRSTSSTQNHQRGNQSMVASQLNQEDYYFPTEQAQANVRTRLTALQLLPLRILGYMIVSGGLVFIIGVGQANFDDTSALALTGLGLFFIGFGISTELLAFAIQYIRNSN